MDTNPFAMSPNAQQQPTTPAYLKQQPDNPTWPGAVNNMVKALMDGNNQFKQRQAMGSGAQGNPQLNPQTTTGGPSVGAPTSLAPPPPPPMPAALPNDPAAMSAGMASAGPMGPMTAMGQQPPSPAFMNGAPPVNVDPVTQSLFSPIPGEMGSQFGG